MKQVQSRGMSAAVVACLLLSGCASLMLEMVWSRLLKLVFGSSTLAVSTILVAYMLGLGLGGLFGGERAQKLRNGIRAYGWIEIAIGVYALLVPFALGLYPMAHRMLSGLPFWPAAFIRFFLVLVLLLLPTVLMGATLPVLVSALARSRSEIGRRVGLLYGINTLGAVAGVVIATFVAFPTLGLRTTNWLAALLDIAVGAVALWVLAPKLSDQIQDKVISKGSAAAKLAGNRWTFPLIAYGTVGFTALAYEVAWTRTLTMVFGSSVYAFATILAVFLFGIALGSLVGRYLVDRFDVGTSVYALGMMLIAALSMFALTWVGGMPDRLMDLMEQKGVDGATLIFASIRISFAALLGPTLILGAMFPLLTKLLVEEQGQASRVVGDIYFVNTLGSALGAFAAGFLLIPFLGLQNSFLIVVAINLVTALVLALRAKDGLGRFVLGISALLLVLLAVAPPSWEASELARGVYYKPELELDFGIDTLPLKGQPDGDLLYYKDGLNTAVSIHQTGSNVDLRLNGKADASILDMSTQVLSGHLPSLFGSDLKNGLLIGYASGVTAGAMSLYQPERLDVIELEPAVIEASHYFDDVNHRPLEQDGVTLIVDDGRTFLAGTDQIYDVIVSEPSNPWITGAANLFTKEYFELANDHLSEDGALLQWIQLYGMDATSFRAVLAALKSEFPNVYGFLSSAEDSDLLLLARKQPLTMQDLPRWEELSPEVQTDLARIGPARTEDLWAMLRLTSAEIDELIRPREGEAAVVVNSDDNMYVELHTPWRVYESSSSVRELFAPFKRGVLSLVGPNQSPENIAAIGIAQLWSRGDHEMALSAAHTAQAGGVTPNTLTIDAELRRLMAPNSSEIPLQRLNLAIERAPNSYNARFARAKILAEQNQLLQALEDLDAAVNAWPNGGNEARHLRAKVLMTLRRFPEAYTELKGLTLTPYIEIKREIWSEVGLLAGAQGDWEEGVEAMRRYLEVFPQSPEEWSWLAQALNELGRQDEAQIAADNAQSSSKNWVLAAHRRALYEELRGEIEAARGAWQFALQRDEDYAPAKEALARLEKAENQP